MVSLGPWVSLGDTEGAEDGLDFLCFPPNLFVLLGTGNCFYVSMPAGPPDSSTDPSGAHTSPSQPDGLPAWQTEPQPPLQGGHGDQKRPSRSPPSLALRDVGMIFRTIEQLTLKLNRLKVRARVPRAQSIPKTCHPQELSPQEPYVLAWGSGLSPPATPKHSLFPRGAGEQMSLCSSSRTWSWPTESCSGPSGLSHLAAPHLWAVSTQRQLDG